MDWLVMNNTSVKMNHAHPYKKDLNTTLAHTRSDNTAIIGWQMSCGSLVSVKFRRASAKVFSGVTSKCFIK
jgi:hypothetical protein